MAAAGVMARSPQRLCGREPSCDPASISPSVKWGCRRSPNLVSEDGGRCVCAAPGWSSSGWSSSGRPEAPAWFPPSGLSQAGSLLSEWRGGHGWARRLGGPETSNPVTEGTWAPHSWWRRRNHWTQHKRCLLRQLHREAPAQGPGAGQSSGRGERDSACKAGAMPPLAG